MALSNQQIERYSRQILVSQFGGAAQERLLKSHLVLAGEIGDLALVLPYLVGAGVGTIGLFASSADPGNAVRCGELIDRMKSLNSEVSLEIISEMPENAGVLALVGSAAALEQARTIYRRRQRIIVLAKMAEPAQIAVLGSNKTISADCALPQPFTRRADGSNLVAMVATAEILKSLASANPPGDMLIQFDGYSCRSSPLPDIASNPRDRSHCLQNAASDARLSKNLRDT